LLLFLKKFKTSQKFLKKKERAKKRKNKFQIFEVFFKNAIEDLGP
jgi:hypothetical protein